MKTRFALLCLLFLASVTAPAATVRFAFTNYLGDADTNWFLVYPVGDVAQADGSFITKGPAVRLTPNASGLVTNRFEVGNYIATNRFLGRGIAFRVPNDHGPTVYCATCGTNNTPAGTGLAISGYNTFVTVTYGTNPPPTYDEITNSLGYLPTSPSTATNIAAYQAALATNGMLSAAQVTNAAVYQAALATNGMISGASVTNAAIYQASLTTNGMLLGYQVTNAAAYQAQLATNNIMTGQQITNAAAYQAQIATNGLTPVTLVDGVNSQIAQPSPGVYQVNVTGTGTATNVIDVAAGANVTITTNALLRTIAVPGANPASLTNFESRKVYLSNGLDITNLNNSFRVMTADGVVQFQQVLNETGVRFTKATGDGSGITNITQAGVVGLVNGLTYLTNAAANSNSYNGTFTGNGAALTNLYASGDYKTLYVAPWGNNTTAKRGDISKPWAILYDYDGTNRMGACSVATNGDRIVLMGTNYVGQAQLITGQTLEGIGNAALLFTNRMSFTNSVVNARGGIAVPSWPWIACYGSNITVKNLYLNATDNSNDGTGSSVSFISLFQCAAPPFIGTLGDQIYNDTTQNKLYYGNSTNVTQYPYTSWTLFGTTNQPDRVIIENCTLVGNVDVFYLNWTQQPTTFYNAIGTGGQMDDITLNCTLPSPGNEAAFWACPDVQAVTWTTNVFPATKQPWFTVKDTTLISYWDHTFVNNAIYEAINVSAYSIGYTNISSSVNYAQGPVLGGASMIFTDVGGKYYNNANVTLEANSHGIKSVNGKVTLVGTTFFQSNNFPIIKVTSVGNISGTYYDALRGVQYVSGSTNTAFSVANIGGPAYSTGSGDRTATNVAGYNLGGLWGNGSGLTNIARTGVTGLEAALSYLTNNTGGGGASGAWNTNGNSGLPAGSFIGTTDNASLIAKSFGVTLANLSGYSNTVTLGTSNFITGWQPYSVIGGGRGNSISGVTNDTFWYLLGYNTISGGATNTIGGSNVGGDTIGGGLGNVINDGGWDPSTISGGEQNSIYGAYGTVGGGARNAISSSGKIANFGTIAGGMDNSIVGISGVFQYGSILGGRNNTVSNDYATVIGGYQNYAAGSNSLAGGYNASATHPGSFVWSDVSSGSATPSVGNNTFNIRAAGGAFFSGGLTAAGTITGNGAGVTNIAPTSITPRTGTGGSVLSNTPTLYAPTVTGTLLFNGVSSSIDMSAGPTLTDGNGSIGGTGAFLGNQYGSGVPTWSFNGSALTNISATGIASRTGNGAVVLSNTPTVSGITLSGITTNTGGWVGGLNITNPATGSFVVITNGGITAQAAAGYDILTNGVVALGANAAAAKITLDGTTGGQTNSGALVITNTAQANTFLALAGNQTGSALNILEYKTNNTSKFAVDSTGAVTAGGAVISSTFRSSGNAVFAVGDNLFSSVGGVALQSAARISFSSTANWWGGVDAEIKNIGSSTIGVSNNLVARGSITATNGFVTHTGTYNGSAAGLTNIAHGIFEASYQSNGTSTAVSTKVWTPVANNLTLTSGLDSEWVVATNALVYTGSRPRMIHMFCTLSATVGAASKDVKFAIAKSGTRIVPSETIQTIAGGQYNSTAMHPTIAMCSTGDAFQLYVNNDSDSTAVTIVDLNMGGMYLK